MTASRLRVIQACLMKHHLKYRLRLEPVVEEDGPRHFGSLFHTGQENYWSQIMVGETANGALQVALEAMRGERCDPFDLAKAVALMACYHGHWVSQSTRWRVHAVEAEFRIPLINPRSGRRSRRYDLGGKIDLVIEVLDGPWAGFYVVEHKTSTEDISPASLYFQKLRLDDQCTIYIEGARSLGFPVRGVIYDVIRRPTLSPLTATPEDARTYTKAKDAKPGTPCKECKELAKAVAVARGEKLLVRDIPHNPDCDECKPPRPAEPSRLYSGQRAEDETVAEYSVRVEAAILADPERYYVRPDTPVVRLDDEMARMRQNIWTHAKRLIVDNRSDDHPLNTSRCGDFFRLCEYFEACSGDADINDPSKFRVREKRHPELSDKANQGTETE